MATINKRKYVNRPPPLNLSRCKFYPPQTITSPSFIDIIHNIDEAVESKLFNYEKMQIIANKSAIKMHNQWRQIYIQQNGNIPRIKKTKNGIEVDINVDGYQLNPEFLEFNNHMALFVATYMHFYTYKDIEEVSAVIHSKWLMMSPWAKGGNLDVPYELLPEIEKEKDRDIFRIVNTFI
jgi:hypothetical protein